MTSDHNKFMGIDFDSPEQKHEFMKGLVENVLEDSIASRVGELMRVKYQAGMFFDVLFLAIAYVKDIPRVNKESLAHRIREMQWDFHMILQQSPKFEKIRVNFTEKESFLDAARNADITVLDAMDKQREIQRESVEGTPNPEGL